MSVTFVDPPGPLANTSEPLDFTTTGQVTSISVEYNPTLGTGARETVYDGASDDGLTPGTFSYLYRKSTRSSDGLTWHVVRTGTWPSSLRLRVQEAGAVGPDLQGLDYSPLAAWALDDTAVGGYAADRASATYTLQSTSVGVGSDLRAGHASMYGALVNLNDSAQDPDFHFTASAFTVILRYARRSGNEEFLVGCTAGTSGFVNAWELRVDVNGKLKYASGANNAFTVSTTGTPIAVGPWYVVSLRRNLARDSVILGANNIFETKSATPSTATNGAFRFGGQQVVPFVAGGLADCVIWPSMLTDAQVVAQYKKMLGLP